MDRKQFIKRLEQLYNSNLEISRKKNADYSTGSDPFKNFRACEFLGITSVEKGILVRMTDKMTRISNLLEKEAQVKDESILDSLQDLSNYAMILRVYMEQKNYENTRTIN